MTAHTIRIFTAAALVSLLLLCQPLESMGAESFFGFSFKDAQSPFLAKDKSFSAAKENTPRYSSYSYSPFTESAKDMTGKNNNSSWNEIDYKNLRFSFNSMLAEPSMDKSYHRLTPADQLDVSQMFPLIFQGSYRDSMQSLGKMIEPQIRMEIRF